MDPLSPKVFWRNLEDARGAVHMAKGFRIPKCEGTEKYYYGSAAPNPLEPTNKEATCKFCLTK